MRRAILVGCMLFAFSVLYKLHEPSKLAAGESTPNQDITSYYPHSITESAFIIHFFATWCKYCFQAVSNLELLKHQYDLPIYGILYRDNLINLSRYADSALNKLFKYVTEDPTLIYKLKITSIPQSCLVRISQNHQNVYCFSTNDKKALNSVLSSLKP